MDFEHQKQTTDTYREQWERVFGNKRHLRWPTIRHSRDEFETHLPNRPNPAYKSGCPILEDK